MFGTNELVGKKFFKDAPKDSLFVTSMFFTLQGEGPYAGQPALFIRLAKCNLTCSFCDTFFDDGDWMTFEEVEKKAEETIAGHWTSKGEAIPSWVVNRFDHPEIGELIDHINVTLVITGGEPLLQDNLTEFMTRQVGRYKAVQVESNGIPDTFVPAGVTLVCSPKCAEKNGVATKYFAPSKTILDRADCLKFVMSADQNSPYSSIPDWALEWKANNPRKDIYVSPMNIYNSLPQKIKLLRNEDGKITMEQRSTVDEVIDFWELGVLNLKENEANHKYTAQYCIQHGLKLNLQMHLYAGLA
jgi:7-carboxy-7-deazaguanine synthase